MQELVRWSWQQSDWRHWRFRPEALEERGFLLKPWGMDRPGDNRHGFRMVTVASDGPRSRTALASKSL
ncbi:hypothetical protein DQL45_21860 (plasmid) [Cereibacter sphaeroides 2.4.1]|jgi:hypothetical protein|nr:hypothetical protein DQL45_21860 [Cereibacter sphaeroides 2.4.1]